MASIRRAYNDRPYMNGGSLFSAASSPNSPKLLSTPKYSSPFLAGLFPQRYSSRKPHHSFRRAFYRCLLFFFVGVLLGFFTPFGRVVDDVRSHEFTFEIEPPHVDSGNDNNSGVVERRENDDDLLVSVVSLAESVERFDSVPRKQLIIVTPTYNRALQAYFLNRLGHVLRLVHPPLLWIVVEMNAASMETAEILRKTGVMYRHLVCTKNLTNVKDRGVHQRNTALEHIEHHRLDGIVYFADDDNIYSLQLFESLREISRFGTWPVAMLAHSKSKAILEGPVCNGSQVIGWHTNEKSKRLRRFHVDMSGFAFNSTILWDPKRWRRLISNPIRQLDTVKEGFQETTFIEQVVEDESQMEGTPSGCSRIMNWHVHLEASHLVYPTGWLLQKNLDVVLPIK